MFLHHGQELNGKSDFRTNPLTIQERAIPKTMGSPSLVIDLLSSTPISSLHFYPLHIYYYTIWTSEDYQQSGREGITYISSVSYAPFSGQLIPKSNGIRARHVGDSVAWAMCWYILAAPPGVPSPVTDVPQKITTFPLLTDAFKKAIERIADWPQKPINFKLFQ